MGWPQYLHRHSTVPTASSTAYGIKTMLLLEEYLAPDLTTVADNLSKMARPGGGYGTQDQKEPSPEATAAVVDALHRIDGTTGVNEHLEKMEDALGAFEKRRPFILTTMLETSVQLVPDKKLTKSLIRLSWMSGSSTEIGSCGRRKPDLIWSTRRHPPRTPPGRSGRSPKSRRYARQTR